MRKMLLALLLSTTPFFTVPVQAADATIPVIWARDNDCEFIGYTSSPNDAAQFTVLTFDDEINNKSKGNVTHAVPGQFIFQPGVYEVIVTVTFQYNYGDYGAPVPYQMNYRIGGDTGHLHFRTLDTVTDNNETASTSLVGCFSFNSVKTLEVVAAKFSNDDNVFADSRSITIKKLQ